MAGKICTGSATNNAGPGSSNLRSSKAFCEGLAYRASGTAAARPATGNPHDGKGDAAETGWDEGWAVAEAVKGASAIDPADAPCCAVPSHTILA